MTVDEADRAAAEARVGQSLRGKWRLERVLGVGGMAAVYEATHRNGKRVAVKMLHASLSHDAEVRRRFLREGYVANAVGHPGAVTVDDDDVTDDGCAFLVMELLDGETLDARCERLGGRLPAAEVAALVVQLLDVLAAAHDQGIVHRDIKPENVFVTRAGHVKVLDFGIARLRERSAPSAAATQQGLIMGTPAFMAPEQARGRVEMIDGQTDLWAVGASLYTLLSGRFVHEAETANEMLALSMTSHARSLATVADVAPALAAVVDRALAYEKGQRWPDARSMQAALRAATPAIAAHVPRHAEAVDPVAGTQVSPGGMAGLGTRGGLAPATTARPVSSGPSVPVEKGGRGAIVAVAVTLALGVVALVVFRGGGTVAPTATAAAPMTTDPTPVSGAGTSAAPATPLGAPSSAEPTPAAHTTTEPPAAAATSAPAPTPTASSKALRVPVPVTKGSGAATSPQGAAPDPTAPAASVLDRRR